MTAQNTHTHRSNPMTKQSPIDEALIAKIAEKAIDAIGQAHTNEARLRALQLLAQHLNDEVQALAAELMAFKGAAARAKRAELAAQLAPRAAE